MISKKEVESENERLVSEINFFKKTLSEVNKNLNNIKFELEDAQSSFIDEAVARAMESDSDDDIDF